MALPGNLNDADEGHVQSLIAEGATEGPHLDLKRDPVRLDGAGRHELLADVCAFANSSGGDLVFGVDEDGEARAATIVPIGGNPDEEARRIQDSILNGIEPRAPGVQVRPVPVGGGFVLVVRVPQSWAGPHRVKSNQHFFVREGARKRQLDIPEIRGMFLRTEAQAQRVRDFRTERVGRLVVGDAPVRLVPGAIEVLHLIPTQAALGLVAIDPVQFVRHRTLPAFGTTVPNARINIDGALGVRAVQAEGSHGYSLLFRSGFFETARVLTGRTERRGLINLPSLAYEREIIELLDLFRSELRHLGLGEEMTAMFTLVRGDQMELGVDPNRFNFDGEEGRFDRNVLAIPDVLLPADQPAASVLRPMFDLVWQAAGLARSYNYNEAGEWVGR
jgi:hypothetical protein